MLRVQISTQKFAQNLLESPHLGMFGKVRPTSFAMSSAVSSDMLCKNSDFRTIISPINWEKAVKLWHLCCRLYLHAIQDLLFRLPCAEVSYIDGQLYFPALDAAVRLQARAGYACSKALGLRSSPLAHLSLLRCLA